MPRKKVPSICGMCTVRCPIMAEVENGRVCLIQGNYNAPGMSKGVCARGAAGVSLIEDDERPKSPMIQKGKRGSGDWQEVSWDEAFDYVANKLKKIIDEHGPKSVLLTDRGGPYRDFHRAFLNAIGSPNYCNHDGSCARNVQHAALSVMGAGRKSVGYDFTNAKHVVLQTRNIFEAINVREVNELTQGMENGCKLSVIDIRSTVTASKANNFFQVRPGTDYAFNLAVINKLIKSNLYNKSYVEKYFKDFDALEKFIQPYTPQWAEKETGVSADRIIKFVNELAKAAPQVIWHPGWMTARYTDSFYMSQTAYIINALLGSIGAKGGLPMVNKPGDFDKKGLNEFMKLFDKPKEKRVDGVGWKYPQFETGPGITQFAYKAIETEDPYPVKAYIVHRHDPLMGFADPDKLINSFEKLDLLVSVTFSWSDTAWYSDVILPMSPYLERESLIACKNDLIPYLFLRKRAVEPRYDTRADWEIYSGLSEKMGIDKLVFKSIEDIWNFQLEGTGYKIEDFDENGIILLGDKPKYKDMNSLKFKTQSEKIEIINEKLEGQGIPSLKPYKSPQKPTEGKFRISFGRCAVHTQGHTVNNPSLFEIVPENTIWINTQEALKLGINNDDLVEVSNNGYSGVVKAKVTDQIHPEVVFTLHGFGHELPVESRAFGKGVADNKLMPNGNEIWDEAGGAVAFQEHFVTVKKATKTVN